MRTRTGGHRGALYNKAEYEAQRRHMMQEWSNVVGACRSGARSHPDALFRLQCRSCSPDRRFNRPGSASPPHPRMRRTSRVSICAWPARLRSPQGPTPHTGPRGEPPRKVAALLHLMMVLSASGTISRSWSRRIVRLMRMISCRAIFLHPRLSLIFSGASTEPGVAFGNPLASGS